MLKRLERPNLIAPRVLSWFQKYGRHKLPWQINPTPYRVWLSEIMLQQTQVTTVLAYFERFTQKFPTIELLACANQDEVLSLWSGLGYYSRARNLHKCAQIIHEQYQGQWPMDVALLEKLPGIGRSTAGAIVSLSSNTFAPILDGNVKRVLTRFFAMDFPLPKVLWEKAEELTSKEHPKNYNQAMMDLGATVCTRTKPRCTLCPLQEDCKAYDQEKRTGKPAQEYPQKKSKAAVPVIHKKFLLILSEDQSALWLYKRPPVGIWGGLWSLPELALEEDLSLWLNQKGLHELERQELAPLKHTFSHYILHLHPVKITVSRSLISNTCHETGDSGSFYSFQNPWPGGLSAPIIKLINLSCS
jgi:A/G-specific adenine glycosylase